MCVSVPINYYMLADFRVAHKAALDDLLSQIIATLMSKELVKLTCVSQDGMRIRASAGSGSYRRRGGLKRCLAEARKQVKRLAKERESQTPCARSVSAQLRRGRPESGKSVSRKRWGRCLRWGGSQGAAESQSGEASSREDIRGTSLHYRPGGSCNEDARRRVPTAYNLELTEDTKSGVIVGVALVNKGDEGQAVPMAEQVEERTRERPQDYLMDGGFASREAITTLERKGITVYAPVSAPRNKPEKERCKLRHGDSTEVVKWRKRMSSDEAKVIYRERASSAEWANAQLRQHGISHFNVRGITNATSVVLLAVIAHNLMRWAVLIA